MSLNVNQSTDTITASTGNGSLSGFNVNFATNRLVNPFMSIDQANEGVSVTLTSGGGKYIADQWQAFFSQTGAAGTTAAQTVTDAPTALPGGKSIKYTQGTGHAISAGDLGAFLQNIEAYNTTDLAFGTASASPVSLSFWVKTSLTGATFSASLGHIGRFYIVDFAVPTANTWTHITIPNIPGDTSGTWTTETNGVGMQIAIAFGVGSTSQGTAGSWQTGASYASAAATNLMATTGATIQITGLQFEPGAVCTPLERRPFFVELANCQRYYEKTFSPGTAVGATGSYGGAIAVPVSSWTGAQAYCGIWQFKVTKRVVPTIQIYSSNTGAINNVTNATSDFPTTIGNVGQSAAQILNSGTLTANVVYYASATADARL